MWGIRHYFKIYHATCHADLVRSSARQAAAAAATAAAVAEAMATLTPSSSTEPPLLSTTTATSLLANDIIRDTKGDIKDSEMTAEHAQDTKMDHDMTTADSDLPTSLKRKVSKTKGDTALDFLLQFCHLLLYLKDCVLTMPRFHRSLFCLLAFISLRLTLRRRRNWLPRSSFSRRNRSVRS